MKQILKRIFHHEELTREEACTLMQRMTGGEMNEAQTAALLAAFQMRGGKSGRTGSASAMRCFRLACLSTCMNFIPLTSWVPEETGKTPSTSPHVPALSWPEPVTG